MHEEEECGEEQRWCFPPNIKAVVPQRMPCNGAHVTAYIPISVAFLGVEEPLGGEEPNETKEVQQGQV